MNSKKKSQNIIFFESLFCLLFFILQYSVLPILKIGNATPVLLLNFTVLCGYYFGFSHGAVFGAISGLLMDSVTNGSVCFFTVLLLIIGLASGILKTYYLNFNLPAAIALGVGFNIVFFVFKWLFFYVFKNSTEHLIYLLKFAAPSALFTFALFIPIYYLFKLIK